MPDSTLQKAALIPYDKATKQALVDQKIPVHFNPDTLKITRTVSVKADTGSKNSSDQAAEQAGSSSATLAVELVFDTTDLFEAQQDAADVVQVVTSKIVNAFVSPQPADGSTPSTPIPANPCVFAWGTFIFVGLVESYNETLEFFSASGVPLRSVVSLSLKENRFKVTNPLGRTPGQAQPLPPGSQIGPALSAAGIDPTNWRGAALANALETPRFSVSGSIDVGVGANFAASASVGGSAGFSVGASADLGTGIAGAFSASAGADASASFSAGASVGFGGG
jgi:Contractile injection system tube protein